MTELIRIPGPGDLIGGQFLLDEEIGRGGFGIVFRAKQLGVERQVAVKMLMPHAMTHEGVVERFKREARLASSLTHRNSVTIYAYGVHEGGENVRGLPYIAMEYLEGVTLHQFLANDHQPELEEAISIVKQSLSSLAEAHKKGIIHRDIKPENIFIVRREDEEETVKVLDFGIAKAVAGDWDPETRERLTRTGLVAGTAEYMAPEQATGAENISPALDVYAMGCIMFQLVAGRIPYTGNSPMEVAIKHISEPIPELPPDYENTKVGEIIRRAMAKEPRDRFIDAAHFIEVLESADFAGKAEDDLYVDLDDDDDTAAAPLILGIGMKPVIAVAIAAFAIFFLVAATAIVIAIVSDNSESDNAEAAIAEVNDDDDGNDSKEGGETDDPTPKTDTPANDVLGMTIEEGPSDPPADALPSSVTVDATPAAAVWLGDKSLGTTPLDLKRAELGDEPVTITLKARAYDPERVAIDWAKLPPEGKLVANLRKSRASGMKGTGRPKATETAKVTKTPRSGKKPKKTTSPAVFDLNTKGKKKPKDSKKKSEKAPTLFAP